MSMIVWKMLILSKISVHFWQNVHALFAVQFYSYNKINMTDNAKTYFCVDNNNNSSNNNNCNNNDNNNN